MSYVEHIIYLNIICWGTLHMMGCWYVDNIRPTYTHTLTSYMILTVGLRAYWIEYRFSTWLALLWIVNVLCSLVNNVRTNTGVTRNTSDGFAALLTKDKHGCPHCPLVCIRVAGMLELQIQLVNGTADLLDELPHSFLHSDLRWWY